MSNNSNKGRLIIFSAPSGAGKSSLIKEILDLSPNKIELSISATTRDARDAEVNGRDYFFISDEEFNDDLTSFLSKYLRKYVDPLNKGKKTM